MSFSTNINTATLVIAAFVGAAISLGYGVPLAVLMLTVMVFVILIAVRLSGQLKDGGVLLVALVVVAIPVIFLQQFISRQFSIFADIWVMLAAATSLFYLAQLFREIALVRWLIVIFGIYLLFSIASSLAGDVIWKASAYQMLYNFKLPAMIFAGLAISWTPERAAIFKWVLWLAIMLVAAGVAFELLMPSLYRAVSIGRLASSVTPNPMLRGLLNILSGPYVHSSMLAVSASFAGAVFFLFYLTKSGNPILNLTGVFAATCLIILSGQQQESLAYLLALVVLGVLAKTKPSFGIALGAMAIGGLVCASFFMLLGDDQLAKLGSQWGFTTSTTRLDSARPVFTRDGVELANAAFPLGQGLGTFGSVGAQAFDRGLYTKLGYNSYWWYRQDIFLLDTYWPNIIAESGWLGGAVLLAFLLATLFSTVWYFWKEENIERKRLFGMAVAGHLIVLSTSLTSPIYSNPSSSAWLLVWTGIAIKYMPANMGRSEPQAPSNVRQNRSTSAGVIGADI